MMNIHKQDRECFVILSAAKDLGAHRERSFAALRMTAVYFPAALLSSVVPLSAALGCHPERSEGSWCPSREILRCAQDDSGVPSWTPLVNCPFPTSPDSRVAAGRLPKCSGTPCGYQARGCQASRCPSDIAHKTLLVPLLYTLAILVNTHMPVIFIHQDRHVSSHIGILIDQHLYRHRC